MIPQPESSTPESDINNRINELLARIDQIQAELKSLEGQLLNRNQDKAEELKKSNEGLSKLLSNLQLAYYVLLVDSDRARQADDMKNQLDILKGSTAEFLKKLNIDPEIWKNIVS